MSKNADAGLKPDQIFTPLLNTSLAHLLAKGHAFTPFESVSVIEPIRDVSSMISLTGPVSVMLLLNFDYAMAWRLMQEEVRELGMTENDETLEAVLGEITNIIGGNATTSLAFAGQTVHLSLPLIFRSAKIRPGLNEVLIQRSSLEHELGKLDVYCVTPAIPDAIETD
ncbi:chemotaxis protein CheX [Rheinheimera baltica]|nr:chemotaxis protein CheX [Rheinheimera baltica]